MSLAGLAEEDLVMYSGTRWMQSRNRNLYSGEGMVISPLSRAPLSFNEGLYLE
jgi:hypothetical protein